MVSVTPIVATLLTGLLLMAVALFVVGGMNWRSYEFSFGRERESTGETVTRWLSSPLAYGGVFVLFTLVAMAAVLAAVGALPVSVPVSPAVAVGAGFGTMLVAFLVLGTYGAIRSRQGSPAEATAAGVVVLLTLLMLAITANLIVG